MMLSKVNIRKGVPPHSREGDSKRWPHHTACEYLAAPGDQQDPLCSLFIVILSTLFPPSLAALLPLLPIRTPFLGAQRFIFVKGKSQRKECHYKTTMSKWQLYPFSPLLMSSKRPSKSCQIPSRLWTYLSTAGRSDFSRSSISMMSFPHSSSTSLGW